MGRIAWVRVGMTIPAARGPLVSAQTVEVATGRTSLLRAETGVEGVHVGVVAAVEQVRVDGVRGVDVGVAHPPADLANLDARCGAGARVEVPEVVPAHVGDVEPLECRLEVVPVHAGHVELPIVVEQPHVAVAAGTRPGQSAASALRRFGCWSR